MKKRQVFLIILTFLLIFSMSVATMAATNYEEIYDGDVIQKEFNKSHPRGNYKITATDTKYYKFTFDNQSVELRTGISIADRLVNLFFGKINIQITDTYDSILSEFSVRCGYSGNVTLKLDKGSTYYIKVTTNLEGSYRVKVNSYQDIGGDSWSTATETLSVGRMISSIDASGDKDWFYFQTDDTDSFYHFRLENIGGSSTMYMYLCEYVPGAGQTPLRDTLNIYANPGGTGSNEVKLKSNTKYYMCVQSSSIGGYQLDVTQTLDAVGDTMEAAFEVKTDTKVTTALDGKYDVDYYKFTTKSYDAYYYFGVEDLSLNEYGYINIYDAAGNHLKGVGSNNSFTTNIKLQPNTEYYFEISCNYGGTGNYSFTITDIPDPYANNLQEAGAIRLNQTVSESVSGAGDWDFFKFTTASKDAYYYFEVEDLSLNEYGYIDIYDAAGNHLKGVGSNSSFTTNIKLSPSTVYYFKIGCNYSGTGNYKVTVTPDYDPESNEKSQAGAVKMNTSYTKKLSSSNDVDWYKVNLSSDYNIRFVGINESGDGKHINVYSAIDREMLHQYFNDSFQRTAFLDAGEYYIRISGGYGYYTFSIGDCGAGHNETSRYTPATLSSSGIKTTYCKSCGLVLKKDTIQKIDSITLSATKFTYNGKAQKPTITVKDASGNEISSDNYSLSYSSGRTNVGKYTVKITFRNAYSGTKTYSFRITAASTSTCTYKLSATSYTYNGKAKKPSVSVKNASGKTLKKGVDYTVTYPAGRTKAGTYKVTVAMKGNYSGTKTLTFKINPIKISKCTVKLYTTSYTYNGKAKTPTVIVKDASGKTLKKNTDYTVTYAKGRKNVGTYKVTVKMKGNYTGTKTLTFKIIPKAASIQKLVAKKKAMEVRLNRVTSQSTGYQIQYSTSKTFKNAKSVTVKSYKTASVKVTGLKANTVYYVRVRTYKTVGGTKIYSGWCTYKSIRTK